MTYTCENHPDQEATYVASMPSAIKVNGKYRQVVPLCLKCAERVKNIGFHIKPL